LADAGACQAGRFADPGVRPARLKRGADGGVAGLAFGFGTGEGPLVAGFGLAEFLCDGIVAD
jgi:hypothetical protein